MTALIFDKAINFTLEQEGGYVNNCHDKGGETNFGICKKSYPDVDICNLTIEQAKEIYKRDYWNRCKCDFIPDALSVAVFDFAVNSGTKRAIKYLQMCLGVKADGIIGNQTIGACNRLPVKDVLTDYMDRRLIFLMGLKDFKYFGNGWSARVRRVREFCERLI